MVSGLVVRIAPGGQAVALQRLKDGIGRDYFFPRSFVVSLLKVAIRILLTGGHPGKRRYAQTQHPNNG